MAGWLKGETTMGLTSACIARLPTLGEPPARATVPFTKEQDS